MGPLYVPMQPDQYGPYNSTGPAPPPPTAGAGASGRVAAPAQAVPPSFYGASVVPSGPQGGVVAGPSQGQGQPQRNPFAGSDAMSGMSTKESRRKSQMDLWQQ